MSALATQDEPTEEMFQIDSDAAANWLLRKLANIEAEKARVQAQATAIVKALNADSERLNFLFGAQLEHYCREKIAQGRGKTVRFLQGTCSLRTVPAGLRISDQGAALYFAQARMPETVRTLTTLDAAAYRERAQALLEAHGELLPGVEVMPQQEQFRVKFGKLD